MLKLMSMVNTINGDNVFPIEDDVRTEMYIDAYRLLQQHAQNTLLTSYD